jgi:pimeloyl-ACP methyl ester carboxylesterase
MPDVKVDTWGGGKFNVYEGGKGPVAVLLHARGAAARSWPQWITALEPHFSVCAPDLLGHGKSEARAGVVAIEHHAASLERLTQVLGLTQGFYLAGAAMAAAIAMELAIRKPKLIRGLLLLGPPAFPNAQARLDWLAETAAACSASEGVDAPSGEAGPRVAEEHRQAGLWALHDLWAIGSYDVVERARQLKARTITAYGDGDPFLAGRPALLKSLPQAEHVLLEGVGHYPAWDAPDRVAELMLKLKAA